MAVAAQAQPQVMPGATQSRYMSLRVKLLIAFTLLFSAIYAGTFYWFYTFASQKAVDRLGEDLRVLIEGAAARIDGDALRSLYEEGEPNAAGFSDDPRYVEQVRWLETLEVVDPRASTFTIVPVELPYEYAIVTVSTAFTEPEDTAGFREPLTVEDPDASEFAKMFVGERDTWLILKPYEDQWGWHISGYTVVRDSNDEIVGVLGADYDASYYDQVRRDVLLSAIPAFAITYIILFVMVWAVSSYLARPILALSSVADRIGEGDYNQDFTRLTQVSLKDEISSLASVFSIMVDKVRAREESLKRQVAELKIEIDEVKQSHQVSEIVDSDFFRDLQAKARSMRSRSKGHKGEAG